MWSRLQIHPVFRKNFHVTISISPIGAENMIILQTPRLILRTWKDSDIEPFSTMNQDPEVMKFFPNLLTPEESASRVDWQRRHFQEHGFCCYAVELKSTGEFIGFVGLAIPLFEAPFMPAVEIGWRIAKTHWNQGYATEAAKYVLNHAFNDLNLPEVVSFTPTQNTASQRVMEKIGMTPHPNEDFDHPRLPEGHPLRRHVLYRITADQIKAKDSIEIEAYDTNWPIQAREEISKLKQKIAALDSPWFVGIEHIGSTAIPELFAKPILDLAIGVKDLTAARILIPLLIEEGYVFWEANPDKNKLFFAKGMPPIGKKRTHHIHVMEVTHHDWIVRPLFRDYLIAHPEERKAYQGLKQDLAEKFKEDREAYTQSKTNFIQKINQKAVTPCLTFAQLNSSYFPVLLRWFNRPHVQAFWSLRNWSLEEIKAKYLPRLTDPTIQAWVAFVNQAPIAFIQSYSVKNHPWPGQHIPDEMVEKSAGIDFFIGEESFLRRGYGTLILQKFIREHLSDFDFIFADPDRENVASMAFFKSLGFKPYQVLKMKNALGEWREYELMKRPWLLEN
jgi:RimJ/RimL family protein N-acetyltransferase